MLAVLEDGNAKFEVEEGKYKNNSTSQESSSQQAVFTLTGRRTIVVLACFLVAKIET